MCWSSAFSSGLDTWGAPGYLCAGSERFIFTVNRDTRVFSIFIGQDSVLQSFVVRL